MKDAASAIALAAALLACAALPVRAEGNRLLPFWGQPYPAGYVWTREAAEARPIGPCRRAHRHDARRPTMPCEVVLHARD